MDFDSIPNFLDEYSKNDKSIAKNLFSNSSNSAGQSRKPNKSNIKRYYLLCKCGKIPFIQFFENKKISYLCNNCQKFIITASIKKIFELLVLSNEKDIKDLRCIEHNEKYAYFYKKINKSSFEEIP